MNGGFFKTVLLLTALTVLLVPVGGAIGLVIAFTFALVLNLGVHWFGDSIALMMAEPKPRGYMVDSESPNAMVGKVG